MIAKSVGGDSTKPQLVQRWLSPGGMASKVGLYLTSDVKNCQVCGAPWDFGQVPSIHKLWVSPFDWNYAGKPDWASLNGMETIEVIACGNCTVQSSDEDGKLGTVKVTIYDVDGKGGLSKSVSSVSLMFKCKGKCVDGKQHANCSTCGGTGLRSYCAAHHEYQEHYVLLTS